MKNFLKVFNGSLRKTLAFSLAEMMVVMLILSLVLAASMPILTRRRHVSTTTSSVPVGSIISYAGATAPTGWLLCSGQAVSTTTYANLYSAIGTAYGSGSGTFNLPDLSSRFVVGAMGTTYTRGATGGADSVTLTGAQTGVAAHTHTVNDPGHTHSAIVSNYTDYGGNDWFAGNRNVGANGISYQISTNSSNVSINSSVAQNASEAHENRPPYIALNYIIKY
ncbi:MAG: tail fiber protein [bacterium]